MELFWLFHVIYLVCRLLCVRRTRLPSTVVNDSPQSRFDGRRLPHPPTIPFARPDGTTAVPRKMMSVPQFFQPFPSTTQYESDDVWSATSADPCHVRPLDQHPAGWERKALIEICLARASKPLSNPFIGLSFGTVCRVR